MDHGGIIRLAVLGWRICAMVGLFLFDSALFVATCLDLSLSTT